MDGDNIGIALRGYADRVMTLHTERDDLNGSIRVIYKEAKDAGFDTTTLREIVRELRMEPEARNSRYQLLEEYRRALGMLADTPLGRAAEERAAVVERPTPFAEQPILQKPRRRGRPRADSRPMFDA